MYTVQAQQMVEAIQRDMEHEASRRQVLIGLPKTSGVANLRRMIAETVISAGTFIQGPPKSELAVECSTSCERTA